MENGTGRDVGRGFQPRLDGGPERAALHRVSTLVAAALLSSAQITPPLTPPKPPQPQAQASSSQPAIVRGHVVVADSGQPLRKAQVRAYLVEPPAGVAGTAGRDSRSATTDGDGKYELTDLVPGRYNLNVFKAGYVSAMWGQTQPLQPGTPLEVKAGQATDRIDFSLQRGGVITGRIFDEFGEPLSGVDMAAMQARVVNGRPEPQRLGNASTNDLGEFRIFGLMPGQYYVQATWRRFGGPADPTSPDRTGYPETFFPGTTTITEAQRFTIRAGQTLGDLVMALSPIKTSRIEGTIVDADGKPLASVVISIGKIEGGGAGFMGGQMARPDGTFTIPGVTPGEYIVRTQPTPQRKDVASMKITVGAEDIKDLRLVAMPPSTISGRIVVDPAQAQALTSPLMISAMPVDNTMMFPMQPVRVADDLSFELTAPAGRARIVPMNFPPGWIIRAVRVNTIDVIDDGLDVKPGENISGVDIELTNKTATISGLVTNARGDTAKDCTVVVFAADSKRWTPGSRYLRTARPDQDGRFRIGGVVAAEYSIVAVDRLEWPGQWNDPEFLQRIGAKATTITVIEGETKAVDLKVTTSGS